MNVNEAGNKLAEELRNKYTNIQAVGIIESNSESFAKHPEMFAEEIKDDSIVVYTLTKPDKKQLTLTVYEGFKVKWIRIGKITT